MMRPTLTMRLGDVTLAGLELPESLPVGGAQSVVIHQLAGGGRVVDAMGDAMDPVSWGGVFVGPSALARARAIEGMRRRGDSVPLEWHEFRLRVVVRAFSITFLSGGRIPYEITCDIVDQAPPQAESLPAAQSDAFEAVSLLPPVPGLAAPVVAMEGAAKAGAIDQILRTAGEVQAAARGALASAGDAMIAAADVLPLGSVSEKIRAVGSMAAAASASTAAHGIAGYAGRALRVLEVSQLSGRKLVTAGGDLYGLASKHLGDHTKWSDIAAASGLSDPIVTGVASVTIPEAAR